MRLITTALLSTFIAAHGAGAIEYQTRTTATTNTIGSSTFISISTTSDSGTAAFTSSGAQQLPRGGTPLSWGTFGTRGQTLENRIEAAEAALNRLYFMRDVCPELEQGIDLAFEAQDLRDVMVLIAHTLGRKVPYTLPAGAYPVEASHVTGMPLDQLLNAVARTAGLTLAYAPDRLIFERPPERAAQAPATP